MYFIFTNDVELIDLGTNQENPRIAEEVHKVGIPRLLDLCAKYDVESTFYFTGNFVEKSPESIDLVLSQGHEVGCHSYSHARSESLDILPLERQIEVIGRAKKIIEKTTGKEIVSFKAPELRINQYTVRALEKLNFKYDSSVSPQRFDGPFSYGFRYKIQWLFAPRKPYYLSYDSPFQRGNSNVLEIPVSAFILPYIGTLMRSSNALLKMVEKYLFWEAKDGEKPILFIFHPNECLDYTERKRFVYEKKITSGVKDKLRQDMKLKVVGKEALDLMEEVLKRAKRYGFEFVSTKRFGEIWKGRNK